MVGEEHLANEWCELIRDGETRLVVALGDLSDARVVERCDAEREEPPPAGAPGGVHEPSVALGEEHERARARGRRAVAYVLVLHESSEPLAQRRGERARTERGHRVPSDRTRVEVHVQHWQQVVQRPIEESPILGVRRRTSRAREQRELQVRVAERKVLLEKLQVARVDRPERCHKSRMREETMRRKHALHHTAGYCTQAGSQVLL